MKKILSFIFVAALMPLQALSVELWKEGTHYKVIGDKASAKPEILEFFSYWCPHCYNFEPLVAQIKQKKGKDVEFKKVQVNFMGFTGPNVQDDASRAMMIARALKKEDELNMAIFKHIHVQRSPVTGLNDLKSIFVANGVDGEKFDKLAKSFGVNSMFTKNNKLVQQYRRHVSSVPNFVVNGKYMATFTRDMTADDIVNLVVWLSKQK